MVTFSPYPGDPRPRRAVDALLQEGMSVDLICLDDGTPSERHALEQLTVTRLPIKKRRGGKLSYAYQYLTFIVCATAILAARSLKSRYHLVHVHNMPDVLVVTSIIPKVLGAKVLLDLHDPMPELMAAIFSLSDQSLGVRLMKRLERWSIARASAVVTVNRACQRIVSARSSCAKRIRVVMNSPDEDLFPFRPAPPQTRTSALSPRRFVVMYHGSLVERNGLDLAVAALKQVRRQVPGAELRIFGHKTPFLDRVMVDVRDKGLGAYVRYMGPRRLEDLPPEIGECAVGVIPNHRNAFTEINTPTRIFEYLALGKPVIAPRTPGIQDYFGPDSLLFFESGNAEELALRLLFVASHPEKAAAIASRGQEVYLAHRWFRERRILVDLVREVLSDS
jgi:glycosyltransferase involved in cell wall biosynthesis